MKVILSRKGFDTSTGGMPSPIMPDGTLLSLPIPDDDDKGNKFGHLYFNGRSYADIILSLNGKAKITPETTCHLDPDLRREAKNRPEDWQPAFGQMGAALSELRNNCVGTGDLFLFFGLFRQTESVNGTLRFKRGSRPVHVIFGYMQVGKIIESKADLPHRLAGHPHAAYDKAWDEHKNAIFLPTEKLSIADGKAGSGTLDYCPDRVLTKDGMSWGRWDLPQFFRNVSITHHPDPWREEYFQSAGRGQEFIMDGTPDIEEWAKNVIM